MIIAPLLVRGNTTFFYGIHITKERLCGKENTKYDTVLNAFISPVVSWLVADKQFPFTQFKELSLL